MTRALARCPKLLVLPRDPDAEAQALRDLLQLAESLTPDFELTTPNTLILDISGCPGSGQAVVAAARRNTSQASTSPSSVALAKGDHSALDTWHSRVSELGLPAHLATGPTPDISHLLALSPNTSHSLIFRGPHSRWSSAPHTSPPLCDVPQKAFHELPLDLAQALPFLELRTSHLELFSLWGLHTLGDLAKLPRQDLAERLGPSVAQLHDILHAKLHRPLFLIHPLESFTSTIHLEHSIESSIALVFLIRKHLHNLCNRLISKYLSCIRISLELRLSNESLKRISIELPEPSASPEILLAPLQARLESLQLSAPVESIELSLTPGESGPGQHQLFGHSIRQPQRLTDTLIRLSALLGDDRIGFPVPHFTHRPDSFHLAPAHSIFHGSASPRHDRLGHDPQSTHRKATPTTTSPPSALFPIASATGEAASQAQPHIPVPFTSHSALGTRHCHEVAPPLSRFRPPLEIAVAFDPPKRGHPQPLALLTGPHRGRILKFHGPFPISGHWWSPPDCWQQLEWDIQLETDHLLRLSHTPPDLWHLQGHYC